MWREVHRDDAFLATRGDGAVARLAVRQAGVVSTAQLRSVGLDRGAVQLRVRNGRLHPLHRGVYAVGHARVDFRGGLWAALLACGGPGVAVISHRSAAALWDLTSAAGRDVDITTFGASRSRPGIRVHRSRTLDPAHDVTRREGLPVTTVGRTLLDLAPTLSRHRLERLCHRAETLRILDARTTPRSTKGTRALKRALGTLTTAEPDLTRSELEERFLSLVAQRNLPRPRTNAHVEGYEADFLWPDHRLIAETDGAATHLTARAFERDRERDARLMIAGYRVVRFTWRQIAHEPRAVAATLEALLAA